ncbi:RidA family protein [Phytomonospora endophytica]|uniref:Enamine deaminase RidA (YjgF/YER057c/UK114 family) n=1 Tax=Phytomonospora endophytica TaxID=714109 RepID=A0A841FSI6_9ACTN|nr:RidA family protein [Phytomonospora endophytica]MBB6039235.1 enamine deaminase RidA (YjgF/YER057c/UK114 family) [Phytomonospora endophytica]GIG67528.1 enamine deaminase RidA [Phytomonospora endophytica]
MTNTLIDPEGLTRVPLYRQVSVATGTRLVHIAGQVAWDAEGRVVGEGDLAAQVERCYLNIATALTEVGGSLADVVKLTAYFVDFDPARIPLFVEGAARASAKLGVDVPLPPLTGLGVVALAGPALLVEIEAVAVLA